MRRGVVAAIALLAAALVGALLVGPGREPPPLATTADGLREVHGAVYGKSMEYTSRSSGFDPRTWRAKGLVTFPVERLCVHVRGAQGAPTMEALCGCRFEFDMTAGGSGVDTVYSALDFPRRDRTLRLRFGQGDAAVAEMPNPFPAPPPASADGLEELPVTTTLGDETWLLSLSSETPPQFVVRAVDAGRNGVEWTFRSAAITDASGNRVLRATDGRRSREHRIALPLAGVPFRLCTHEPWWELEIVFDDARAGQTVRWRFRPPQ